MGWCNRELIMERDLYRLDKRELNDIGSELYHWTIELALLLQHTTIVSSWITKQWRRWSNQGGIDTAKQFERCDVDLLSFSDGLRIISVYHRAWRPAQVITWLSQESHRVPTIVWLQSDGTNVPYLRQCIVSRRLVTCRIGVSMSRKSNNSGNGEFKLCILSQLSLLTLFVVDDSDNDFRFTVIVSVVVVVDCEDSYWWNTLFSAKQHSKQVIWEWEIYKYTINDLCCVNRHCFPCPRLWRDWFWCVTSICLLLRLCVTIVLAIDNTCRRRTANIPDGRSSAGDSIISTQYTSSNQNIQYSDWW